MEGNMKNIRHFIPLKIVIFIYTFLCGIPFGAIGPVTLQAVEHLVKVELGYGGAGDNGSLPVDNSPCSGQNVSIANAANVEIQEQTVLVVMVTTILGNFPSIPMTILASSWLDSAGSNKRWVALLPCVGFTVHMAIYLIISGLSLSPWYTLIPAVIVGFGGNFYLQTALILAYLGSITKENERSFNILLACMISLVAQGISNVAIGFLIEGTGFTVTFAVLLLVCTLMTIFVFLFLPNIELTEIGDNGNGGGTTPAMFSLWKNIMAVFRDPANGEWNYALVVNASVFFFYTMISLYLLVILQIVALGEPFCWSPSLIGYFSATKLLCLAIGMTVGAKILNNWFDDYGLAQIGFVSVFISTIIPVYARTDAGLFLVTVLGAFRMVPGPILTSNLSKLVKTNSYGSLFGVIGVLECVATITAPSLFGTVYQATLENDPMFVFKLMAGLIAIPSALILSLQFWNCTSGAANYKDMDDEPLLPAGSSSKQ